MRRKKTIPRRRLLQQPVKGRRIVLVEDDKIMGASLVQRLTLEGAEVQWHRQIARALPAIRTPRRSVDAVICDIRLPDGTGEDLYETLTRTHQPPPFLFITGQGGIDQAVRLIRSGAADYITKPFDLGSFLTRLATVMQPRADLDLPPLSGISDAARRIDRQVAEAALRDGPVLIRGASGLGKLRLARRIHAQSDRCAGKIVVIDTQADSVDEEDLCRAVDEVGESTLILNTIERLTMAAQDRLMDMLDPSVFRLIATTGGNHDSRTGQLRGDLMAMLQLHEIVVPPLSDRPEDAVWLAAQLFRGMNARRAEPLTGIAATTEEAIRAYDWPGNGRELRSRLARAIEKTESDTILVSDLFPERSADPILRPLAEVRDAAERAQITAALERTEGQVGEAAKLLRVSRTTLWEKMQKLGL